jgi:hypothetical protein
MKRVRGEDGGMSVAGREPAELSLDLVGPDSRRLQDRGSPRQLDGRGRRRRARGAALPVEGDPLDPAVLDGQRDADQIAAGSAPGRAAECAFGRRPSAGPISQVMLEQLPSFLRRRHSPEG